MASSTPAQTAPSVSLTIAVDGYSDYLQGLLSGEIAEKSQGRQFDNRFNDDPVREFINSGDIVISEKDAKATDPDTDKEISFKSPVVTFKTTAAASAWFRNQQAILDELSSAASLPLNANARNSALRELQDPYDVFVVKTAKVMVKNGAFGKDLDKAMNHVRNTMSRESVGL